MDDSTASNTHNNNTRIPLGMSSFDNAEREQFGQHVRIAMACIEGTDEPVNEKALPLDEPAIRQRLKALTQDITSQHADLLELLVRFDETQGWKTGGACHCAAWMNQEIGIGLQLGWEYLRTGRLLRSLPTMRALFRAGKLTWSKIRILTRVADENNERVLCHAALDASVSDVKRLCEGYRWKDDDKGEGENDRALKQWESRSLRWDEVSNGSTCIRLVLPPEIAQAFLCSLEHSLRQLEEADSRDAESTISQRRADAAVLMAEASLQSAGRDFSTADRYQVVVSVDASELAAADADSAAASCSDSVLDKDTRSTSTTSTKPPTPSKRPSIKGAGPIACETARRIACDCCVTVNTTSYGEPVNIGRKSRLWPAAMARAIKDRDQHCQFPGCTHTQNLQIHHIQHWADNGETSIANGVCMCSYHHTRLHEGGYTIQRIADDEQILNEQFTRQQNANDPGQFDFEKNLRNDKDSFDTVRRLSPTRYRFRVLDADGLDIRDRQSVNTDEDPFRSSCKSGRSTRVDRIHERDNEQSPIGDGDSTRNHPDSPITDCDSIRVHCAEPHSGHYDCTVKFEYGKRHERNADTYRQNHRKKSSSLFTSEQHAYYDSSIAELTAAAATKRTGTRCNSCCSFACSKHTST